MEVKVGEIFQYSLLNLKVKVVKSESNPCEGCYFGKRGLLDCAKVMSVAGPCSAAHREDGNNVVFVEVKKLNNNYMEMQGYKIIPPKGMECYLDGSEIKFKPIKTELKISCYNDVARELFAQKTGLYLSSQGTVKTTFIGSGYCTSNNCTSYRQGEKVLAINKLLNVAKYLNDGWAPDWNNCDENKYYFYINSLNQIDIDWSMGDRHNIVYFKTEGLARKAIEILGEDTIRLALTTDY